MTQEYRNLSDEEKSEIAKKIRDEFVPLSQKEIADLEAVFEFGPKTDEETINALIDREISRQEWELNKDLPMGIGFDGEAS